MPPPQAWLVAAGLCAAGLLTGCVPGTSAGPAGAGATPAPTPAITVPVREAAPQLGFESALTFTGRVEARRLGRLGFERAGRLAQVLVREGDVVRAGDLLARLDLARLTARREELAAALASAEADLALAEATAARFRESVQDGAVTRQALDEAVEGARAAAAGVRLARARIATVDVDLAQGELRAPYTGTITDRLADEGQVLAAGAAVLALQEQAPPEIRVGVAGRLTHRLTPGGIYRLHSGDEPLEARLRTVLPRRTATSRTVDALFDPVDAGHALRPGELVRLTLTEAIAEPGFWLPLTALTTGKRGLWQALVAVPADADDTAGAGVAASHRLEPRPVQVLELRDDHAYVSGPVAAGERVVTAGLQRVVAGQLVRVTPAADGASPDAPIADGPAPAAHLADTDPRGR